MSLQSAFADNIAKISDVSIEPSEPERDWTPILKSVVFIGTALVGWAIVALPLIALGIV